VPDTVGRLSLELELDGPVTATNSYETEVQPDPAANRH